MPLFGDIGTVFVMGVVGMMFTLPVVIIPKILAPRRPNPIKNAPFECGQVPIGVGKAHFMMQYYAYLLMFLVFDVLAMFLYAWAAAYRPLGLGLASDWMVALFMGITFIPLGYALFLAGRRELW